MKGHLQFLFIFFISLSTFSQIGNAPDCVDALGNFICEDADFQLTANGQGIEELLGNNISNPQTNPASGNAGCILGQGETNSTWMIITIANSGELQFSFGAAGGTGFFDWIMWPYSPTACDEIANNTLPPIRCNWNGPSAGFTGVANPLPPGASAANFEPPFNVQAGEQYLLHMSNFSSSVTNLPLSFFGTAGVTCNPLEVSVNDANICPGDEVVLTASAPAATGTLDYLWSPGNQTSASITVSPAITSVYTVTVTETLPTGVETVGLGQSTVIVLDQNDPQCSCSVDASNNGPICFNATFDLSATAVSNGTYEWDIIGDVIGSGQNLTDLPALAPGTWPIQVTAVDDNGFVCTDVTQLIIIPPTDPQCSCIISALNSGPICYNATYDLNATSVSNGTYEWSVDGNILGTEQNLSGLAALPPGIWTIQVSAIDDDGLTCIATTELEVLSETDASCSCTVTASHTSPRCVNDSFDLSAVSSSNCTYQWELSGAGIGDGQNMTGITGANAGSFLYEVTATDENGYTCNATTEVLVNALPFISAGLDEQICFGEEITLAASGGVSYNWFDGTQWLNNITNEITFNISNDASFIVEGEDVNGCINTDTVLVIVNAAQLPILNTEASVICLGESVELSNLNTNAEATSWYFSNGTESIGINDPSPFFFNDAGCYDLTINMVDNNGCDTSLSFNNVVCVEEPLASFYTNPGVIGPGNGEVYFFNTSVGADYYLWEFGDGDVSTLFEDVHTYDITQQTGYQATLIAFSSIGCQDSVSLPITYQEELIYYIPNSFTPDADEHNQIFKPVFTSGFDPFNYEIAIYNRWGEIIWKSFDHTQGWDGSYSSNKGIPVQEGQYSWVIKFKPKDTDGKVVIHGIVNVLK